MRSVFIVAVAIAATGCTAANVHDTTQTVEGAYDAETRYDMSSFQGLFAGLAGQWRQPDIAISSAITGQVSANYGSTIAAAFTRVYGAQLQNDIRAYLNEETPPWVMGLGGKLDKVDTQMKTLDVQTSMLLSQDEAQNINATQIFNGIAVFRDPDCRDSGAIVCDQLEISSQSLLDSEYPVEILSADYVASRQAETLNIDDASVDFNYGRLGLYILANQILPDEPTEQVGLRDVVMGAINCRGLAGRLAGSDDTLGVDVAGVNVGLSLNDLIGNCQDGVFAQVNGFVDGFNVPLGMDMGGTARVIDTNRDGAIDQLTDGQLAGDMNLALTGGQTDGGPVSAQFVGFRVGDLP
ncbi:MAG: hypothetical protein R3E66_08530 [bacterium]